MELKKFIEAAEVAVGSQKSLGLLIGQSPSKIRDAKSGRCGLPTYACVMIADLIGEDHTTVIAASELVTEKKSERRAFWEKKLEALAAGVAVVSVATVTLIVTPSPAKASSLQEVDAYSMYIMSNSRRYIKRLYRKIAAAFGVFYGVQTTICSRPACYSN